MNGKTLRAILHFVLLSAVGCTSTSQKAVEPDAVPMRRELVVSGHVGGTHHRAVVRSDIWYQTFANKLLVVDPGSARALRTLELGPFEETGPAVDIAFSGERAYVVLEDDALVTIELSTPDRPRIAGRRTAADLGLSPRRVVAIEGDVYVYGRGGVVRLSDRSRFLTGETVNAVALAGERPVAVVGRRVLDLATGQYLGAASDLLVADVGGVKHLVFALQGTSGALVGLMGDDVRELDSQVLEGTLRRLRVFDGRVWAIGDTVIASWAIIGNRLEDELFIAVKGARDVDRLDANHLAIAGSFGRAVYRINPTSGGAGDTFVRAHREASRLTWAATDGRRIVAGSEEGTWKYMIGDDATLAGGLSRPVQPSTEATTTWGRGRIADDGTSVAVTVGGDSLVHTPEPAGAIGCVMAIDGDLWVGHASGIDVVTWDDTNGLKVLARLRFEGTVRYIFPHRLEEGASFVSEFGGFGVANFEEVEIVLEQ